MDNARIYFQCLDCPKWHLGIIAHRDQYTGVQLYEVTCPDSGIIYWFNLRSRPHRDHA